MHKRKAGGSVVVFGKCALGSDILRIKPEHTPPCLAKTYYDGLNLFETIGVPLAIKNCTLFMEKCKVAKNSNF